MRAPTESHALRRHGLGVSLLEVLIALVLIATVGLSLLAWMQQSLATTGRLQAHVEAVALRRETAAWMQQQDLQKTPQGETSFGELRLRWRSEPTLQARRNMTFGLEAGPGPWDLSLLRVSVEVWRGSEMLTQYEILSATRRRT